MQANNQWATRPSDERFLSLTDMAVHFGGLIDKTESMNVFVQSIIASHKEDQALNLVIDNQKFALNNWGFRQICSHADAPAQYLAKLPPHMASTCLNHGLNQCFADQQTKLLIERQDNGTQVVRAATGATYGRIWNHEVVGALINRFGDGVTGDFRVPGEFGEEIVVDKENTTLYAGERDMFVFLADEKNRIELPNRRDGKMGTFARGFFVWNSEVGANTLGVATFLFDYACSNRIVWGAQEFKQIKIRHSSGAPERFLEELQPVLAAFSGASDTNVINVIEAARSHRLNDPMEWMTGRFNKSLATKFDAAHIADEGRPIETRWDVVTGMTAHARTIEHQNVRVNMEREAGKLLTV